MSIIRFILTPIFLGIAFVIFYLDYRQETVIYTKCLAFLMTCAAMHELVALFKDKITPYPYVLYGFLAVGFFVNPFLSIIVFLLFLACVSVISKSFNLENLSKLMLFFVYMLMISLVFYLDGISSNQMPFIFLFMIATNKGHDSFGYLIGKSVGRTKLTHWSPNKTVEGFVGGMIGGSVLGFLVLKYTVISSVMGSDSIMVITSISVTLFASVSDIFESMFKRLAQVKDSSGLVPEFGGFLDMMDSFFLSVPVLYIILKCI